MPNRLLIIRQYIQTIGWFSTALQRSNNVCVRDSRNSLLRALPQHLVVLLLLCQSIVTSELLSCWLCSLIANLRARTLTRVTHARKSGDCSNPCRSIDRRLSGREDASSFALYPLSRKATFSVRIHIRPIRHWHIYTTLCHPKGDVEAMSVI